MFYKGLKEVGGNESKINVVHGKNQISFFVGSAMAAQYTPEGDGLAGASGIFNLMLLPQSVQISVKLFLKQLSIPADVRTAGFDSDLSACDLHQGKTLGPYSSVPTLSFHPLHSRDQVLGCAQSGTAFICVLR